VAASHHGDTPYSGNSATPVPVTPYTTSVDVNSPAFVAHLNNPHGLRVYLAHISHLCEQADSIPDSLVLLRDRVVFLGLKMRRVLVLLSTAHLPGLPA